MEVRSRKKKEQGKKSAEKKDMGSTRAPVLWWIKKAVILIIICSISLLGCIGIHNGTSFKFSGYAPNVIDAMSLSLGLQEYKHVVVIDAGSTGSRVLAFTFHVLLGDGSLKLADELWAEVKPGLSSFADEPQKGAESINKLLDMAKERIPEKYWSKTPLVLRATAGLRLLPEAKADNLLNEIRSLFLKSGFLVSKNSVSILDGTDEGIFSWVTLNFLLDRIGKGPSDSVATLDLGGGSTQVTLVLSGKDDTPDGFIMPVQMMHEDLDMYTHSYLGLGLMEARNFIFKHGLESDGTTVHSSCINPIVNTNWQYQKHNYIIKGSKKPKYEHIKSKSYEVPLEKPIADYPECYTLARELVLNKVHRPKQILERDIYAMSYYFDRAADAGLIDPYKGGKVVVKKILETARKVCETPNVDQPFACIDLTFISALLREGLGLDLEKTINLYKKIDGHETSWGLGAGFHTITNEI